MSKDSTEDGNTSQKQSPEQKENADRFREATAYAKNCMKIPDRKALYEKGTTKRKNNAYTVACTDYQILVNAARNFHLLPTN